MKIITKYSFIIAISLLLFGCALPLAQYGENFKGITPEQGKGSLVIYTKGTFNGQGIPIQINSQTINKGLVPNSYTIIPVAIGLNTLNTKSGLIDLVREIDVKEGGVYYAELYETTIPFASNFRIQPVSTEKGLSDLTELKESHGWNYNP